MIAALALSAAAHGSPTVDDADASAYERGKRLLDAGRYDEAAAAFQQAAEQLEHDSGEPATSIDLPTDAPASAESAPLDAVRQELAAGQYVRALIGAQRVLDDDPSNAEARRLVVQAYQALGGTPPDRRPAAMPLSAPRLAPADAPVMSREYRLGEGDLLEVFVWQHSDLSRDVIVRPDGRISFPLVGDVDVAGKTLTEIDDILTERLRTYLRYPDVSLAIKRFGGTKTILLGEVSRPGIYVPAGEGRVLDVIAMAGGFTKTAGQNNVFLMRGRLPSPRITKLNLDLRRVLKAGTLTDNVPLQPNDILFVPPGKVASVTQFLEQFYPTINAALVGSNVAQEFGFDSTLSDFWKKESDKQ